MWTTRDVLLMTVAVATLTIIVTILANRKLNDMIDAKADQRNAMAGKSVSPSPMLSVLGNMNHGIVSRETPSSEIPVSSPETSYEPEPSTAPAPVPAQHPQSAASKPQGAGERWTPL